MKKRILTNWTFRRVLYLLIGIAVIVESVMIKQWIGIALGGYFAAMGLFSFGCAAGNCFTGNCKTPISQKHKTTIQDVDYEEIKTQ